MRWSVLFSGWLIRQRKVEELRTTELTYLPPIDMKVTDFKTIIMYLEHLQALANSINMKYVNITLNVELLSMPLKLFDNIHWNLIMLLYTNVVMETFTLWK